VNLIENSQPFTFIRYGDGEWSAILNDRRRRTGSGSHSLKFPGMQIRLRQSLQQCPRVKNYIVALRQTAMKKPINHWIAQNATGLSWHDCTVFYKASKHGRLYPFIKALRQSKLPKIVVGPPWMRKLNGPVFKMAAHVEIPPRDCWLKHKEIVGRVLDFGEPAIIMISAGPPAKVFAWEFYQEIGKHSFILDLGTLWDVYCTRHNGKRIRSRQYMRRMTKETIRRNLHGE
jgi:hypothetical protein